MARLRKRKDKRLETALRQSTANQFYPSKEEAYDITYGGQRIRDSARSGTSEEEE